MKLSPQDQKVILQIIEKGVAGCADKLAMVSHTKWEMQTTSMKIFAQREEVSEFGPPTQYYFGAYCQAPGKMFLNLYTSRSAEILTKAFLSGSKQSISPTPLMQESAVAEISNIVINAVAASLADACGMALIFAPPKIARGSRSDIIHQAFGEFASSGRIFSAYIHLASSELTADCTLMLMLDDLIVNYVLNAMERKAE